MESRSIDTGGTKTLVEASSDGVGVIIPNLLIDNSKTDINIASNSLIYIYSQEATDNGNSLANEVLQQEAANPGTIPEQDIIYANILKNSILDSELLPEDGTICDDNNPETINDVYTDYVCSGVCDDGDINTIDKLIDGTCQFLPINCLNGFGETYNNDIVCSNDNAYNMSGLSNLKSIIGEGSVKKYYLTLDLSGNNFDNVNELSNLTDVKNTKYYTQVLLNNNQLTDISGLSNLKIGVRDNNDIYSLYSNLDLSGNPNLEDLSPLNNLNPIKLILDNKYYNIKMAEISPVCTGLKNNHNNSNFSLALSGGAEPFMICENGFATSCKNGFASGYSSSIICSSTTLHGGLDPEINGWAPRWESLENHISDLSIINSSLDNLYGLRNLKTIVKPQFPGVTASSSSVILDLSGNNLTNVNELSNLTEVRSLVAYSTVNLKNNQLTDISGLSKLKIGVRDDNPLYNYYSELDLSENPNLEDLSPLNNINSIKLFLDNKYYTTKILETSPLCIEMNNNNNKDYSILLSGGAEYFMVCENGAATTCKNGFFSGYENDIICTEASLQGGLDPLINGWAPRWENLVNHKKGIYIKNSNLNNLYGLRNLKTMIDPGNNNVVLDLSGNNLKNLNELSNLTDIKSVTGYSYLYLNNNQLTDISGLSKLKIGVRDDNKAIYGTYSKLDLSGNSNLQDLSPLNTADITHIILDNRNYTVKLDATHWICQNNSFSGPSAKEYICNP